MTDFVLTERRDATLIVTLNRPERKNAFTRDMITGLEDILRDAAEDATVRALVLTGADGTFCVGGDVKAMNEGAGRDLSLEEQRASLRARMEVSDILHNMPKPTIAAIEGAAAGAGLSLALACDFRVSASTAKITTAFAKVGLSGDFGGTYFLTKLVGAAKARELYFTAEMLDAARALELGVVNRVVPDGDLDAAVADLAGRLAKGPSVAYGYMKKNLNAALDGTLEDSLDLEAWAQIRCAMTEDHKEAAQAFVEKRAPVFKGR